VRAEYWLLLGLVLAIAEVLAPGTFMIFVALGAFGAAAAALVLDDLRWQLLVFALASGMAVLFGRELYARLARRRDEASTIGSGPVGEHGTVVDAIVDGRGKVKVRDSVWLAAGPDLAAGTRIVVARRDGTLLEVRALDHGRGPLPLAGEGS